MSHASREHTTRRGSFPSELHSTICAPPGCRRFTPHCRPAHRECALSPENEKCFHYCSIKTAQFLPHVCINTHLIPAGWKACWPATVHDWLCVTRKFYTAAQYYRVLLFPCQQHSTRYTLFFVVCYGMGEAKMFIITTLRAEKETHGGKSVTT